MADQTFHFTGSNGKDYAFTADHEPTDAEKQMIVEADTPKVPPPPRAFTPIESATHIPVELKRVPPDSLAATMIRGTTAALPVIGGTLGGMVGAAGGPIGSVGGVGGGSMGGEHLRQLLNNYLIGDRASVTAPIVSGLINTAMAGTMAAAPAAMDALSPSAVLSDVEKTGSVSPGRLIPGMVRRGAAALRTEPPPILTRPSWQAAEAPPNPDFVLRPVTDAERTAAGTLGRTIQAEAAPNVNRSGPDVWERAAREQSAARSAPATPQDRSFAGTIGNSAPSRTAPTVQPTSGDVWDRLLDEARQARGTAVPPTLQEQYSALTREVGKEKADTWLARQLTKGQPSASSAPTAPSPKGGPPPSVGPRTTIEETGETPEQWRARVNAQNRALSKTKTEATAAGFTPEEIAANEARIRGEEPPSDIGAERRRLAQQLAEKENGGSVGARATRMKQEGSAADTAARMNAEIQRLRNEFSAEKLGPILNPGAPEAAADAVRKASGGAPSEMPDVAQRSLHKSLQSGQMNDRSWRALAQRINELTKNNGPVKTTADTQQLLEWLKKYGFKTGQE